MRRVLRGVAVCVAALMGASAAPFAATADDTGLVALARGLPWPHVSGLIGYDGRLWFVNSLKFVNHNSADLYGYDPATGKTRYERHLFSQDAGDPVVARGLLYWPFEESRWNPGRGEYMVTDGERWRWGLLPAGRAFHVHAMARHDGALYAAPSAWRARLLRSIDGGTTWRQVYEYPAPPRTVSRIVALGTLAGVLYAGISAGHDPATPKVLRATKSRFAPLASWPAGTSAPRPVAYRGWLYGTHVGGGDDGVWRTDGTRSERITALAGVNIRALAADNDAVWAVSSDARGGALWRSRDGVRWTRVQRFDGPRPADVAVHGGHAYVGARASDGGMLLGPAVPASAGTLAASGTLPRGRPQPAIGVGAALTALDRVLAAPARLGALRRAVAPLALSGDPKVGEALARRLAGPLPGGEAGILGGRIKVSAGDYARWHLMWAMAHNGHGRVPPALLAAPWDAPRNRAEKYVAPAPGAAWTAAQLGQRDAATLAALVARLDRNGDPKWLKGDMIGALSALTGQRFGYDVAAWRRWWAAR